MQASDRLASRLPLFAGLFGAIVLVAACSSAGGASTAPSTAPSVAASVAPSASTAAGGKGGYGGGDEYGGTPSGSPAASAASGGETYEIAVASSTLGKFLTGEEGKTLYTFKADTANTSNCSGQCADNWPALFVDDSDTLKAGTGVTGALTTFTRADGKKQAAYNGAPLYYFIGDSKAGDTNGQGAADKWFVAAP